MPGTFGMEGGESPCAGSVPRLPLQNHWSDIPELSKFVAEICGETGDRPRGKKLKKPEKTKFKRDERLSEDSKVKAL